MRILRTLAGGTVVSCTNQYLNIVTPIVLIQLTSTKDHYGNLIEVCRRVVCKEALQVSTIITCAFIYLFFLTYSSYVTGWEHPEITVLLLITVNSGYSKLATIIPFNLSKNSSSCGDFNLNSKLKITNIEP